MTAHISPTDLTILDAEPRIHDLKLAEALGYERPRTIRDLIRRNRARLLRFGELFATVTNGDEPQENEGLPHGAANPPAPNKGGRPGTEYWLSERQALRLCTLADTDRADDVSVEIINVFYDWRRGLIPPKPPSSPAPQLPRPDGPTPPTIPAPPIYEDWMDRMRRAEPAEILRFITELRLSAGPHAARAAMQKLGMPVLAPPPVLLLPGPALAPERHIEVGRAQRIRNARACLRFLLDHPLEETGSRTIRQGVEAALDGDLESEALIGMWGVRSFGDDEGNGYFAVSGTRSPALRVFLHTKWEREFHYLLRALPGADWGRWMKLKNRGRDGVCLPASYLDPAAVEGEGGG